MPAEELKCHSTLRSACDAGLSSALNGGSNSDETNPIVAAAIVVGLLLIVGVVIWQFAPIADLPGSDPAAKEATNKALEEMSHANPIRQACLNLCKNKWFDRSESIHPASFAAAPKARCTAPRRRDQPAHDDCGQVGDAVRTRSAHASPQGEGGFFFF